jgi:hypothetical protein
LGPASCQNGSIGQFSFRLEANMNQLINSLTLKAYHIDKNAIRLVWMVIIISMLVIGAGAPGSGGDGYPGGGD